MPPPVEYEVRVLRPVGPAAGTALSEIGVRVGPTSTVLSGALDQPVLLSLLEGIQALGFEVIDVRRTSAEPVAGERSSGLGSQEAVLQGRLGHGLA